MVSSSSSSSTTTSKGPPALLSIAESLISTYYPSAAISSIASEVLPSTVVVNSKTYVLHGPTVTPSSTTGRTIGSTITFKPSSPVPSASSTVTSQSSNNPHHNHSDENIAIILGSLFGALILALILVLLFLLCRRKRRHGSYFKGHDDTPQLSRRPTLSSWMPPMPPGLGTTTHISAGGVHDHDIHARYAYSAAPEHMSFHSENPVFLGRNWQNYHHHHTNSSTSESRPLVADNTGIVVGGGGGGGDSSSTQPTGNSMQPYELDHEETNRPGLFPLSKTIDHNELSNMDNSERAPTPFLPALLMPGHHGRSISDQHFQQQYNPLPPPPPKQRQMRQSSSPYYFPQRMDSSYNRYHNHRNSEARFFPSRYPSSHYENDDNNNDNDEDEDEARDLVSPIVPVRGADRLPRWPLVHYPSRDEISEFDFSDDGEHGNANGNLRGGVVPGRWSN